MKFNIVILDPPEFKWTHFCFDSAKTVYYGILSAGYPCSISRAAFEPGCINIIFGADLIQKPFEVQEVVSFGDYVVYQNEAIVNDQINGVRGNDHFDKVYLPLLQNARAVWEGIPHLMDYWKTVDVRAQFLLWGYHPALEEIKYKRERDIDFLFFGSITEHRLALLNKLKERGHSICSVFDHKAIYRNDLIARAKVHLSMRQHDVLNHLAWCKHCYLINNRGLVVSERCRDQEWLEPCFITADTDQWVDACVDALNRPDRQEIADGFYEQYKKVTMADRIGPLLAEL